MGRSVQREYDEEYGGSRSGGNDDGSKLHEVLHTKVPRWAMYLLGAALLAPPVWSSWYVVGKSDQAVVTQLGQYSRTENPGLHGKLPWPFEKVDKVNVQEARRLEFGFTTVEKGVYEDQPQESTMLTGDENIASVDGVLQYQVVDPARYIFRAAEPEVLLRDIGGAALRQVVGDSSIDAVLTTGKNQIQEQVKDKIQGMANEYDLGIKVVSFQLQDVTPPKEVAPAFLAVQQAKEQRQTIVNDAEGYRNSVLGPARGKAQQTLNEAGAYAARVVGAAEGETQRFLKTLEQYQKAPEVTADRLTIETLERTYGRMKVVVDGTGDGGSGLIKLLNLSGSGHEGVQEGGARK